MDILSLLKLIGGLAFFLFGMNVMSGSLGKMAGGKLEHSLQKVTSKPLLSLILGTVITIAVQSSSATTVMLVGLVNSGIMAFSQTIYVIFGSNIGTTLTSWILSLSAIDSENIALLMLKPENFSTILALIGVMMMMISKKEKKKSIGTVLVGFAVLMFGMKLMSDFGKAVKDIPGFGELLLKFSNPFLLLLVGIVFTAVIQSSAASIGILQALSLTGLVTNGMAVPIVMGQNIGTCATALISCIGTEKRAKRVAILHFSIKIIGTVLCLTPYLILDAILDFKILDEATNPWKVALIHSIFNILTTFILMPFSKLLIKFIEKLIPDAPENKDNKRASIAFIDERLLNSPSVAIREVNNLSKRMCGLSEHIVFEAIDLMSNFNEDSAALIVEHEDEIDIYEDRLGTYLVKLSTESISVDDSRMISKMLHTIGDFERLGDHALNLSKTAREIHEKQLKFSPVANEEIEVLVNAIGEILINTTNAYINNDIALAARIEPLEQVIDGLTNRIKTNHIERLQHGDCTIEMGFVLSDLLTNYERISDHCSNIAVAIIEAKSDSFDSHAYLNGVKYNDSDFNTIYADYSAKYKIAAE